MARYNYHPAQGGGHYHNIKIYKDRQASYENIKQAQQVKKLRKKRRKGR